MFLRPISFVSLAGVLLFAGAPCATAQDAAVQVATARLYAATTTATGQPIALPKGTAEVVVWMYEVPVSARLPVHKHSSQRYAYVLAGTLRVATADDSRSWEYKAGDFIVEMIGAWHYGTNTGNEPVRLLVIDQVEQGEANTVLR
jgi:quercetin dioxygenase-like cupin family protein